MRNIITEETEKANIENKQHEDNKTDSSSLLQADLYVTPYVCLLAPRFEEHLLTGDLADQLHVWMKDICISFGWKLKFIDINPNYLHWIIVVSITEYPIHFIKIIRKESSKRIFDDFPKFKQKNMSPEFWAPWFFVGVGEAPYSHNTIQTYLKQIRIEQGLQ